jgi:hypothetical protein
MTDQDDFEGLGEIEAFERAQMTAPGHNVLAAGDEEEEHAKAWFGGELNKEELAAIMAWLRGKLGKNSQEEQTARRALARALLVGEPLPKEVRWLLSECFDPRKGDIGFVLMPTRTRGRPKARAKNWEIAEIVERRLEAGDLKKQACGYAADKLGVSDSTAEKVHAQEKEQIRAIRRSVKIITRLD